MFQSPFHIQLLACDLHPTFFQKSCCFLSVRTNGVFFAFFVDAFPWQGFEREEYGFSLPPAQSFDTRKNRSYLFDFQCLMRYIVLWKSSSFLCLLYVLCNTKILLSSTSLSIHFFHFFALCTIFPAPGGPLCILHYREKNVDW